MTRDFSVHGKPFTEKVAGILRRGACGVKEKDTIASGRVADRSVRHLAEQPAKRKFPA
jgi:hypothetical protein